ncbi:hypothetical protein ACF0H5_009961 [Mactra antiquata]
MRRNQSQVKVKDALIVIFEQEMAVQTWTLWQRMPPRYQLTTRCYDDDDDDMVVTGNSGSATDRPSNQTSNIPSRPLSSGRRYNPVNPASARSQSGSFRENFMLSNNDASATQQEVSQALKKKTSKSFSFPKRNSDYVNTFQLQRRVNSARRRLAEAPPTPNYAQAQSTVEENLSPRARTAPVFPVTNPETHKERSIKPSEQNQISSDQRQTKNNLKSKSVGEPSKIDIFHFDDAKSVSSSSSQDHKKRDKENKPKKYVVQDTSKATVYIDNGKVMYFGKSRHDLTQLLKTQSLRADRNTCFLAEIRRDYLKHPKYDRGRSSVSRKTETDPRRIASERVDYNRRVEHILNYYDENGEVIQDPQSRPTSGYRSKSPKGGRVKGLSLTLTAPSRPPSRTGSPCLEPTVDGHNDFIRLNKQLKLHERQFYLRTPGIQHGSTMAELEKCRCSMCRMELQLAIVTGVAHDGNPKGNDGNVARATQINKEQLMNENKNSINGKPGTASRSKSFLNARGNAQRVSFHNPEVDLVAQAQEPGKYTISCTLPDVDQTLSESGFESARTHDVVSTIPDDVDN